ncbi:MAG: Protein of unknown function (DUF1236) [Rhodobacteraceae bacterium HLUCCA12]|nr:MAG: Protein of unknown function (DUF1236) [Rhodobacteraceae bacterium HLUCCA12]
MNFKLTLGATVAGLLLATTAQAETTATAWTDLNLRAGPSISYDVVAVIPAAQSVTVDGCLDESNWCRVMHGDVSGWASGDYLTAMVEAPIASNRERLDVQSITYERSPNSTIGGGAAGAIAGAIVGGPVGALIGAAIGMGAGAAITPDERVTTYVRSNPVDPVYLDGEVVVGAGLPETVPLAEVPESEYHYAYINGVRVLVERDTRQVVYIVR